MITQSLLLFFFRVLNVIIVSALFAYVFKKYLYGMLCEQLRQSLALFKNLKAHIGAAKQEQARLDKDFSQQKVETQALLEKVKKWHLIVVRSKEKHNYEINVRLNAIKNIRKEQEAHYEQSLIRQRLVPAAFHQANIVLTDEYRHNKKKAQQFVNGLIQVIEK